MFNALARPDARPSDLGTTVALGECANRFARFHRRGGRRMRTLIKSILAVGIFALAAGSANASVIDFSTGLGGAGGTINIGTNITGSGIFIDTVTIIGAPLNNGIYDVEGT